MGVSSGTRRRGGGDEVLRVGLEALAAYGAAELVRLPCVGRDLVGVLHGHAADRVDGGRGDGWLLKKCCAGGWVKR
jgi:hypothetical protein